MKTLAIFDYGAGNLYSLRKALEASGLSIVVEPDPTRLTDSDLAVLPGVGAFAPAAARLAPAREWLRGAVLSGFPLIGICLGMQLFLETSEEGPGSGLALLEGNVRKLHTVRAPHIGWNTIERVSATRDGVWEALPREAYFANSYACDILDRSAVIAESRQDDDVFPVAVRVTNAIGVQFHPEKSSRDGVEFLRAVVRELLCS